MTFDKCRDELEDITVNWGHSTLFVSYIAATLPLFNSILNTVCFLTFNIFIFENCIAPEKGKVSVVIACYLIIEKGD